MDTATQALPTYVVLGAYGGIGNALCRRLAARGARLLIAGRDGERLAGLATELGAASMVVDGTQTAEVEACLARAHELFGRIDGAANCIGSLLLKPAHLTSDAQWRETIDTNLGSAFALVRAAGRAMAKTGGAVVLVSSAAARLGLPNHEAIAAAKAGIIGLTLSAAATYAPRRLRINAVAPGLVETPLTSRLVVNEAARRASVAMHPAGRLGRPDDVASLIDWLLQPENDWVTGQVYGVDGGLATLRSQARETGSSSQGPT